MKIAGLLLVVLVTVMVIGLPSAVEEVRAASCDKVTPKEHIEAQDIIFFGRVTKAPVGQDNKTQVAEFEVLRAYKGVRGDKVKIEYFNDYGTVIGWGFGSNQPGLVFAYKLSDESDSDTVGTVHYCSMMPYHQRRELHPDYWDILVKMNP